MKLVLLLNIIKMKLMLSFKNYYSQDEDSVVIQYTMQLMLLLNTAKKKFVVL